jgi:transcriptional regulator with XRE-family HTH domain
MTQRRDEIARRRAQAGFTQESLAEHLQVARTTVARRERGEGGMSIADLATSLEGDSAPAAPSGTLAEAHLVDLTDNLATIKQAYQTCAYDVINRRLPPLVRALDEADADSDGQALGRTAESGVAVESAAFGGTGSGERIEEISGTGSCGVQGLVEDGHRRLGSRPSRSGRR